MQELIVIEQTGIRQANGLYCLNDLHRAAGNESRHKPDNWLRNQQAQELIAEIEKAGNPAIQANQSFSPASQIWEAKENQSIIQVVNGIGTFACRELVYAYAMWISPRFHLAVIRAFDALQAAPKPALPDFSNPAAAARAWAEQYELNQAQAARLQVVEPKAAAFDRIGAAQDSKTVTEVARIVKLPRDKLFALLQRKGWLFRQGGVWQGYADAVARGLVTHGVHNIARSHGTENRTQVYITAKGIAAIARILEQEGAAA